MTSPSIRRRVSVIRGRAREFTEPLELALELERLVVEHRLAAGLSPARPDRVLCLAAMRHSEAMCERDFFAHIDPTDGGDAADRVLALGGHGWHLIAENLAAGQRNARQVFD